MPRAHQATLPAASAAACAVRGGAVRAWAAVGHQDGGAQHGLWALGRPRTAARSGCGVCPGQSDVPLGGDV